MKADQWKKEEIAEDYCFICKDGGHLRVCDFKKCLKAYHSHCVGKDATFLDDDNRWTCGSHMCNCGKNSIYQCFCCPVSFCHSCIKSAEFVQVKKKTKGFCINCLRLAKMIEENRNVDSDGEEVDFSNTDTYEFLFKDYWVIVKDQEGLSLVDVQASDVLLKRGKNFPNGSDSDKPFEEDSASEPDDLEDDCDDGNPNHKGFSGKRGRRKTPIKKSRGERTFAGWASQELVKFLTSLGKDMSKPLSQVEVTEIVKEYVQSKNLFQTNKKRKKLVIPDEKLHSLFRKKKLKYHKIFDLLKGHLAEERSDPDDELTFGSEEDEDIFFAKRQRGTTSDYKTPRPELNQCKKKVLGPSKSCYAAMFADNIKLIYIKRSLMLELLKNSDTYEDKTLGCFVRVKNDPKDSFYLVKKPYQLGQVKGIKKAEQTYKIGETTTNVVLCISNFFGDVKISMLSDDDIEEEECEDLRQLVKKGLFKPPTVEELESKTRIIHKDIIHHWIEKEIAKLQKQIDRANEKGWRRELNEYIDRRELLRTPEEQMRLMEEIPEVIADTEGSIETNMAEPLHLEIDNKEAGAVNIESVSEAMPRAGSDIPAESEIPTESRDNQVMAIKIDEKEFQSNKKPGDIPIINLDDDDDDDDDDEEVMIVEENGTATPADDAEENSHLKENGTATAADDAEEKSHLEENGTATAADDAEENSHFEENGTAAAVDGREENSHFEENGTAAAVDGREENSHFEENGTATAAYDAEENSHLADVCDETDGDVCDETDEAVWHYVDPLGNEQGPFTLTSLRWWKESGYFDDDFKVWRSGEHEADAILLTAALSSAFPDL